MNNTESTNVIANQPHAIMCCDVVLSNIFSNVAFQDLKNCNLVNKLWGRLCNKELRERSIRYFNFPKETFYTKKHNENLYGLVNSREFLNVMKKSNRMPASYHFKIDVFDEESMEYFESLIEIVKQDMQYLALQFGTINKKQWKTFKTFFSRVSMPQLIHFGIQIIQPNDFDANSNVWFRVFFTELFRVAPKMRSLGISWHSQYIDVINVLCLCPQETLARLEKLQISVKKVSKENLLDLGRLVRPSKLDFDWRIANFETQDMKGFLHTLAPVLTNLHLHGHQHSHTKNFVSYKFPVMQQLRKLSIKNRTDDCCICTSKPRNAEKKLKETITDIKLSGIVWDINFPQLEKFAWTHRLTDEYEFLFENSTGGPHLNVKRLTVPHGFNNTIMLGRMASKFPNVSTIKLCKEISFIQAACSLMENVKTVIVQYMSERRVRQGNLELDLEEMNKHFRIKANKIQNDPAGLTAFRSSMKNVERMFVQNVHGADDIRKYDLDWFMSSLRKETI